MTSPQKSMLIATHTSEILPFLRDITISFGFQSTVVGTVEEALLEAGKHSLYLFEANLDIQGVPTSEPVQQFLAELILQGGSIDSIIAFTGRSDLVDHHPDYQGRIIYKPNLSEELFSLLG